MAGKFVCVSSDEDLKERVELPDRVVLVNNGAFDLEQKGLSGFYVWIGYKHNDSGSSEISMKSVLQKTTHSVGKWLQEYAGTKYEVDDFWKDLEMYRVWAGGENMDVDRKKKNESIEIREDFRIPGTNIVLEKGDMIYVVSKQNEAYGDDYQKLLHGILELVERYGLHRKYKDRDLDRIIMDAAEEASIRAMDL